MTEGQTLYLVLVALYAAECFWWLRRGSLALTPATPFSVHPVLPGTVLGGAAGGLVLLNPLFPPGRFFLAHLLPVALSPEGIAAGHRQTLPGDLRPPDRPSSLAWDEIRSVATQDRLLLLNGSLFARCPDARLALCLARAIDTIRRARAAEREGAVRDLVAARYRRRAARRELRRATRAARNLRWVCVLTGVVLFVGLPLVSLRHGLTVTILPAIAVALGLTALICRMFVVAHRRLHPAEKGTRLAAWLKLAICPPMALRAPDLLTARALEGFSPLLAASLLSGPGQEEFLSGYIRDLEWPLATRLEGRSLAVAEWWRQAERREAQAYLSRHHPGVLEGLQAPRDPARGARAYCPRCLCDYVREREDCPDCPGVGLQPLAALPAPAGPRGI